MDFLLFLVLNAVLLIRPAEIVPELLGLPIYEVLILVCLLASGFAILRQLEPRALLTTPITVCLFGVLAAVVLSHLSHAALAEAHTGGERFGKVVLYYLLIVANLRSTSRIKWFLGWTAACILVLTILGLLQYHGAIDVPALSTLEQREFDPETGDPILFLRLRSTGIFNDPNDLSLILVVGIVLCLFGLGDRRGPARVGWLVPLAVLGYALALTQSRGGFLALLAALAVLFTSRFGWKVTLLGAAVALPLLFLGFAGRQTSLSTTETTSQERIQLWSEGLVLFRQAPIFGIGEDTFADHVGLVAHNSYLHSFAELGFVGGTCFVGVFFSAYWFLWRLRPFRDGLPDPELRRLYPYLLACTTAYAVGMFSLSRVYVAPTYLVVGVVTAYAWLTSSCVGAARVEVDLRFVRRLLCSGAACLLGLYLFVRLFVQRA